MSYNYSHRKQRYWANLIQHRAGLKEVDTAIGLKKWLESDWQLHLEREGREKNGVALGGVECKGEGNLAPWVWRKKVRKINGMSCPKERIDHLMCRICCLGIHDSPCVNRH